MFATYSHHAASIGARNRELMLITLADRLRPPRERDPVSVGRRSLIVLRPDGASGVGASRRGGSGEIADARGFRPPLRTSRSGRRASACCRPAIAGA